MPTPTHSIPTGYKPSPLGPIPQDWEVLELNKIGKIVTGNTPLKSEEKYWNGEFLWASATDFTGKYIFDTKQKITKEGTDVARVLPKGSILVTCIASIGLNAIAGKELSTNQQINAIIPNDMKSSEWIYYGIEYLKPKLQALAGKTAVPIVSKGVFEKFKIIFPPLPEQTAIATILSTVDTTIQQTQEMIKKLELRNKRLQQNLLTGKIRLKGFYEKWETVELGDVLDYIQPTPYIVQSTEYDDKYKFPVLTAGKTFILGYTNEEEGVFQNDLPVIIFDDFTTAIKFVDFPFKVKSSAMKILKKKNVFDNIIYIYGAMQQIKYMIGGHERHWISKYAYLTIPLPSPEEQKAIADVFDIANQHVTQHKQKLAKLQSLKKGLMQQLLTGKVRVKEFRK